MTREGPALRERIRNRALTREQRPILVREVIVCLLLAAMIALPSVFWLWQQNAFVRCRFAIEALRKEKLVQQERYRRLRIERATLESLGRLSEEARRLGLAPRPQSRRPHIMSDPQDQPPVSDVLAGRRGPEVG